MECHGVPEIVIVKGRICYENEKLNVEKGFGKFVPSKAFNSMIYNEKSLKKPEFMFPKKSDGFYVDKFPCTK